MSGRGHQGKGRKNEACLKGWEAEGRVCPNAQICITGTLIQGTRKHSQRVKIVKAAAKTERWAMPTWCHGFNSTLTVNARVWGELAASNHERKKIFPPWKQHESSEKKNFKKRRFPNSIKIDEMLKAGKLSHLIKEIKQTNGKEQPKVIKKGETSGKDKALAILMVQPWESVARQRITQSFSPNPEIFFPPLGEDEGMEGPMIIKAEIGGHCVHRMYVDGGSASKIMYEHYFSRLYPKIKKQLIPATTPLIGFSGEIIWPMGQIQLLIKIRVAEHSALAWMNFMIVRSQSPYNEIIGRPGVRKLQAVPSTAHEMLKILTKEKRIAVDRNQEIQEEVRKLVGAGIMREVHYHDWLSNPVMVKKHDGSWRMCVDFKDLNKACLKDGYSLPEIDWKVESLNAGATYQRLVDKAFHKQIGKNMEVYVDDFIIKSHTEDEIVRDVEETFKTLREINMKLNPKKYAFGVEEGMFLGYKVNAKGLKVCPDKTTEAEEVFKQMKQLIAELPMLTAPMEKEELIVYLATAKEIVSAVLMTESEAKQMTIYFVSRELKGLELNYTSTKKLVLVLVLASKRLKRWFRAGLILTNLKGKEFTYALRFGFDATNNEVEYEAFIAGLRIAEQMGVKNLQANVDLRLVANQVNETYVAKEADMIRYLKKVKALAGSFKAFSIKQIPRSENKKAGALSKIASTSFAYLSKQVMFEELKEKPISEIDILAVVEEEGDTWMTPLFKYLAEGTLPADANYVLREIHEGSCSMHAGTRSVMDKALRTGYYWPTMHRDARTLIRACQDCQVHKPVPRNPQQKLTLITSPWLFYKRGIDIAGPFLEGSGKVKLLIVAMDYFTKWIEAKPVATINNGKQFRDDPFKDWCEKLCIRQHFASVKHPQTNGLVERANHSLGEGIKARLDARSNNWIEELPHVLWAHHTMIKSSNEDTPFSLTYGMEAVIPAEIGMPTLKTAEVDLAGNNEALETNLDLL
uniref:Reverse transcriptase domain-containing protein n=1 Tax=Tanacetum cinerariifolium TaxID=118510 RepID=A0A6L2MI36_TANCI|nr:reverse transcriptase domain-containing protein [Tanacetum cinerariifolium]